MRGRNNLTKSFSCAFEGLGWAITKERNLKIHLVAAIVVSAMGFWFEISAVEWLFQLITIGMVVGAELFNTAIERLTDDRFPEIHPTAKIVKDVSAGAVLFMAIIALAIGLIIYLPKFIA